MCKKGKTPLNIVSHLVSVIVVLIELDGTRTTMLGNILTKTNLGFASINIGRKDN